MVGVKAYFEVRYAIVYFQAEVALPNIYVHPP